MMWRMMLVGLVVCLWSGAALADTLSEANAPDNPGAASRADATNSKEPHYWSDAGYGMTAVIANMAYMPAKVIYASLGTLTGGLAYLLTAGDSDTAQRVWSPSLGGSYVITPAMLQGNEPILFNGVSYSND